MFESFESKIYINEDTLNNKCENCDDCDTCNTCDTIFEIEKNNNNNRTSKDISNRTSKDISNRTSKDISNRHSKDMSIVSKCFSRKKLATFDEFEKYAKKVYLKNKNKIKGEVWITPTSKLEDLPQITMNGYYINNLCVLEKYRRQGIARELMNYVIKKCRDQGGLHLMLQVDLNDDATMSVHEHYLVKFYKSLGFSVYEYGSNIVLMFMAL